jgi:hypothetical protein
MRAHASVYACVRACVCVCVRLCACILACVRRVCVCACVAAQKVIYSRALLSHRMTRCVAVVGAVAPLNDGCDQSTLFVDLFCCFSSFCWWSGKRHSQEESAPLQSLHDSTTFPHSTTLHTLSLLSLSLSRSLSLSPPPPQQFTRFC